jgi:hypothetical protein
VLSDEVEARNIAQRIRWALLNAPADRKRRMAVLREELAKVREEIRPMAEDFVTLGVQAMSDGENVPKWMPVAAVVFTALTLISLFYLILRPEDIPPSKHLTFDVWMSLCVAASISFIGGTAQAHGRIPFFQDSPVEFMAVGGAGVFIVIFLILHYFYP